MGVFACRVAAGGLPAQGALVVSATLSPPAGLAIADACVAPGGSAVLARTSTGALLMVSLDAARPSGPPPATGDPSAAELDDPTLPTSPVAAADLAAAAARSSPREAAGAGEAGSLAGDAGSGESAAGGQAAGPGPAAVDGSASAGAGAGAAQTGGAEHRLPEAAGEAAAGLGAGAQDPNHMVEDRGPWDVSKQAWALVAAAGVNLGVEWRSGSGRAFQPLPNAFHAGGAVAVSAAEHQPLLATLGGDNVLR